MSGQADSKTTPAVADNADPEKTPVYNGRGTEDDPFLVEFLKDDPENPMNWSQFRKWFITTIVTLSVFAVTFTSSAYSVSSADIMREFDVSVEVFIVGVSLFVLGFAIGPAVWGPLVSMRLFPPVSTPLLGYRQLTVCSSCPVSLETFPRK